MHNIVKLTFTQCAKTSLILLQMSKNQHIVIGIWQILLEIDRIKTIKMIVLILSISNKIWQIPVQSVDFLAHF